jgi:transglutaminase-like putative cysteine protease
MKTARRVGFLVAAALLLGFLCLFALLGAQKKTLRHFELSEEYDLYFSNTDEIIAVLHDSLAEHASAVTLRYTAEGDHMDEISAMLDEMMNLAMYNTASPTQGDYVRYQYGGYQLSYGYTEESGQRAYTVTIQPNYYTTVEEEAEVTERVADVLEEMNFGAGTSDYEKIKAIYDYVCTHVSYDHVHAHNSNYHRDSTAYAALVKGSASCQGYAVTMYRLLKEVGIENTVVTGTAVNEQGEEEFHAWNKVELDGVSYLLDATWDAGKEEYEYFMLTEEDFPRHTAGEGGGSGS